VERKCDEAEETEGDERPEDEIDTRGGVHDQRLLMRGVGQLHGTQ
jgi:hypothetical protein